MERFHSALVAAGLFALGSCTVGPDYATPKLDLPDAFSRPLTQDGGEPQPGTGSIALARWWHGFGDETLDRLVERALAANLDLASAHARVREARAAERGAEAGLWPWLGAQGAYTHERMSGQGLIGQFLPGPEFDLFQAGFDARWEIDVFGGSRRAVEAAHAQADAAQEAARDVQVSLAAEVARHYVALRGAERRLAIAEQNVTSQRTSFELTRERFQAGLSGELDVAQSRALLSTTESMQPRLRNERDRALHRLGVLLGLPPESLRDELLATAVIPGTASPDALARRVPVGIPAELLRRRPDVRRAERALAAATARVGVATADLFPRFSLTGNLGLESISSSDFFDLASRTYAIGPSMRWPIFEGGRVRAEIEVSDSREEQALLAYRKAVLESLEDVENALVTYAEERTRHERLTDAVDASRRAVALARDLYHNGLGNFLQVLDSERSLYAAEDSLVLSDGVVALDLVALFKSLGGGWDEPTDSARDSGPPGVVAVAD